MGRRGKRVRIGPGIYRDPAGWSAIVKVPGHKQKERRFRPTADEHADLVRIQRWQLRMRVQLLGVPPTQPSTRGTLAASVPRFLATMPEGSSARRDYEKLLMAWTATPLGQMRRDEIRRADVLTQLAAWEADGYAPGTVNHRLRALRMLYEVLDGDDEYAVNPTDKIQKRREPDPIARGTTHAIIEGILDCVPEMGYSKRGEPRPRLSKTKARLRVMTWTGLPPALIRKIRPEHIHWAARELEVTPRRKGKGVKARRLPLIDEAVSALRAFDAAKAYGPYSNAAPWEAWRRAKRRFLEKMIAANTDASALAELRRVLANLRPYDLRHSWLTTVFRHSKNLKAVKDLAMHSSLRTSERYIESAVDEVSRSALDAVAAARASLPHTHAPQSAVSGRNRRVLSHPARRENRAKRADMSKKRAG